MASTVTRLSDVIVPEVYSRYLTEESIKKTGLYRSGIMTVDSRISEFVAGGGTTFNLPFFQQLTGEPQAIQSSTTIETKKVTTDKMVARRLLFAKAWSAEELASALSGEDVMGAISGMVDQYWNWNMQRIMFAVIKGVIADNEDNDSGDLVNDITTAGSPENANKVSAEEIINTVKLFGDHGDELTAIAMHSTPYYNLVNLIDYEPENEKDIGFGTFMGKTVIVTDELTADTEGSNSVYWNIMFRPGSILYGESAQGITPVETDRTASKSEDQLYTRRQFCMHPTGFKWIENSVTDDMPTRDELEEAGNWDRVYNLKNCGFSVLKTNG